MKEREIKYDFLRAVAVLAIIMVHAIPAVSVNDKQWWFAAVMQPLLRSFVGIYFMIYNIGYGYPYFAYTLSGVMLILLVLVPVITMRSFAEEKKNRTDQLPLDQSTVTNALDSYSDLSGTRKLKKADVDEAYLRHTP